MPTDEVPTVPAPEQSTNPQEALPPPPPPLLPPTDWSKNNRPPLDWPNEPIPAGYCGPPLVQSTASKK